MFIEKENQMTKRNKYSTEFKRTVCEYYSNHTGRDTLAHFGIPTSNYNIVQLSRWYKALGFLPKSAGMNPNPDRVSSTTKKRAKSGVFVRSGGFIHAGKFMGKAEFLSKKDQLHPMDTYYEVTEHKVGATIKRNPIAKLFSRFI